MQYSGRCRSDKTCIPVGVFNFAGEGVEEDVFGGDGSIFVHTYQRFLVHAPKDYFLLFEVPTVLFIHEHEIHEVFDREDVVDGPVGGGEVQSRQKQPDWYHLSQITKVRVMSERIDDDVN